MYMAAIASLVVALPISAYSDEGKKDEKKQGKKDAGGQKQAGKQSRQPSSQATARSSGRSNGGQARNSNAGNNASNGQGRNKHEANSSAAVQSSQRSSAISQSAQQGSRSVRNQRSQPSVPVAAQQSVQPNARTSRGQQDLGNAPAVASPNVRQSSVQGSQYNSRASSSQRGQQFSSSSQSHQGRPQSNSGQQQYTRENNYGGLWFAGNTHGDWNRDTQHYYNNHNYRWYQNGWLIIDAGFSPEYSSRSSIASDVQARLADLGYYRGPIDGDIGPGSRNAIANYQDDNNLRVTGRINEPLLQSLQLN